MTRKFKVRWEVGDGYAGGSRPHWFEITDDFFQDDDTETHLRALFQEELERNFRDTITPYSDDEDAFVAWAIERQKEWRKVREG